MPESQNSARTDYSVAEVEIWTPGHIECGREFLCERVEFLEYWNDDLTKDVDGHVGRAWIIRNGENLAAYITLSTDALTKKSKSGSHKKRFLESEGIQYAAIPAIKIGRLARHVDAKGAGKRLMDWALPYIARELAPRVGVRFVTVDALYDSEHSYDVSGFYANYGFQHVRPDEKLTEKTRYRSMFLDIKPLVEALKQTGVE